MNKPILGVIGGIGTAATDDFCSLLTQLTPAKNDQEHLERFVHNNPKIPDRTSEIRKILHGHLSLENSDIVKEMVRSILILNKMGATAFAAPCNAIHYFVPEVLKQVTTLLNQKITFIHIVEEVVKYCKNHNLFTIGLLSTEGTAISQIYPELCHHYGVKIVTPDSEGIADIMDAIYGYRNGLENGLGIKNSTHHHKSARNKTLLLNVIRNLGAPHLDALILGCTEIPLCLEETDLRENGLPPLPLINSTKILAQACIDRLWHRREDISH